MRITTAVWSRPGRRCWLIDVVGDGLTLVFFLRRDNSHNTTATTTSTEPPALAVVTTPKNQQ